MIMDNNIWNIIKNQIISLIFYDLKGRNTWEYYASTYNQHKHFELFWFLIFKFLSIDIECKPGRY